MNSPETEQPDQPKPIVIALGIVLVFGGFVLNEFTSDSWAIPGLVLMLLGALLAAPLVEPLRDRLGKTLSLIVGAGLVIGGVALYTTILISAVRLIAMLMGVTGALLLPRLTRSHPDGPSQEG